MDIKTGILVCALLVGCFGGPTSDDNLSNFFDNFDLDSRIFGGTEAAIGSHPHMVAITIGYRMKVFLCGGSLVSQRTVLTAAHCVHAYFGFSAIFPILNVVVGTNHVNSGGEIYSIERNVSHPHYEVDPIKNDIALLITTTDVKLSPRVQIVPITFDFIGDGVAARVAGWGSTSFDSGSSTVLRELQTTTVDGDICVILSDQASLNLDLNMLPPPVDPQIEVCTLHSAGVGNCHGDSGSAITRISDGAQFGIVSWTFPCALGAPDVYVRLSAYRPWLEANIV